jgi:hypothetical protein
MLAATTQEPRILNPNKLKLLHYSSNLDMQPFSREYRPHTLSA